jgi:hypothetical protein
MQDMLSLFCSIVRKVSNERRDDELIYVRKYFENIYISDA